jgi:cyclophilin family peptidyl-prolyl cis-trans isomerase
MRYLNFPLHYAATFITIIFICWPRNYPPVWAEPLQESPQTFNDYTPTTEGFRQATQAFKNFIGQLVELEIRFHNSVTPDEGNRLREQWYEFREQGFDLYQEMLSAALAEYLLAPAENRPLADLLFGVLKRNAEADVYEGLLPIALALYENQYPAAELNGLLIMCSLANNEFELARNPLEKLIAQGRASNELIEIFNNLDELTSAWNEELEKRKIDSQGEPLPLARVTTTKGTLVIELFENDAPEAVANFISLVERGFYRYSQFFMVLSNLMAQTGCPSGDGMGGPGYFIPQESAQLSPRRMFRGSVSLALLPGMPDSGGSQFMIAFLPVKLLENQSRVFGRVVSGMPNVAKLNRIDPSEKKKEGEPPAVPDEIITIEIIRKRDHAYEPTRLSRPLREDTPDSAQ